MPNRSNPPSNLHVRRPDCIFNKPIVSHVVDCYLLGQPDLVLLVRPEGRMDLHLRRAAVLYVAHKYIVYRYYMYHRPFFIDAPDTEN